MIRRLIIILLLLSFLVNNSFSQSPKGDKLLRETTIRDGQAIIKMPNPGRIAINKLSGQVSISSVTSKYVKIVLSPQTVEWFIKQNYDYVIISPPDSKSLVSSSTMKEALNWTSYPTYIQYDSIMQSFIKQYPALCKLDTIGMSIYGKLILALKISDNPGTNEDEPEVFYSSTIHGNEPAGFVLMLRLAEYLLKNYSTDSRVKNLVDNLQIWINPLANPDGAYRTGNTISSPVRFNANGIDLNRNFPDPDGRELPEQIETTEMIRFMRSHHFVISANFHSGDEVVNYPWDRWVRFHADDAWFYNISRKYADTAHLYSPAGYMDELENGVTNGYAWYQINGGRQDFMTYELHGREVTIELDYGMPTSASQLDALWQYNWRSLLGYIENALYGIHGNVTDKSNGKPVMARIFINGHDKDSSQVYSDSITGNFTRLIIPGIWTLEVSAKGYTSCTITNVEVVDGEATNVDIELLPVLNSVDTIPTPVIITYPDPASELVNIVLPERQTGYINVRIFDLSGKKIADYFDVGYPRKPIFYDTSRLASGLYSIIITNKTSGVIDRGKFLVINTK